MEGLHEGFSKMQASPAALDSEEARLE